MRIIQVVTYLSEDGSFGGPTRVAQAQSKALARRGHQVTLFAASPIDETATIEVDGYTLVLTPAKRLLQSMGFAGVYSPGMFGLLRRAITEADVVHVHLARDLVSLPAAIVALVSGVPLAVQTHGMIDRSSKLLAKALDIFFVKSVLRRAKRVFTLTDREDLDIIEIASGSLIERIKNGMEVRDRASTFERPKKIIFLSRLQERKRPVSFVEMAAIVAESHSDVHFEIAGADEGQKDRTEAKVLELGLSEKVKLVGPINPDDTQAFLESGSIFVLPSFGEVFPMVLLEAFAAGTPSVVTSSLGLAQACLDNRLALVTDGSPEELASACVKLLENTDFRDEIRTNASNYLRLNMDIEDVAEQLEFAYSGDST